MRILTATILALVTGLAMLPASADDSSLARFSAKQRELINHYARNNGTVLVEQEKQAKQEHSDASGKGQGKAHSKQKDLPPGIAKNLARGKPLPPGIAKNRLPPALVKQLPPPPKGKEIAVVDGRVLLIDIATQVVHDRIEGVLFR